MRQSSRAGWGAASVGAFALTAGVVALAAPAVKPAAKKAATPAKPAPAAAKAAPAAANPLETQARTLLARECFSCHAEKVQMGGLRLDTRAAMLKGGKAGPSLVPGDPAKSLLLKAVHYDGAVKMPPAGKLKDADIEVLERWIKEGASWGTAKAEPAAGLWSLQPIKQPPVPKVKDTAWVRNPIDNFVLSGIEKRGWKPSPPADRRTLIRRATLDLAGLPPVPEEVDAFAADQTKGAWERAVDRLLGSRQYGERMALHWLDLARYADSDGYHDDTDRYMWRYRDWVINAFNANKPFDQFTVEQLAGDLLPNATTEQKIASAFNRCGPTSSEGGAIPEEYLAKYAVDRVNTTTGVWLGLTVQCAECHTHKYDPITINDYYGLFAFFNQVPEDALYRGNDAPPTLLLPTPEQQKRLDEITASITALEAELKACLNDTNKAVEVEKKIKAARESKGAIERVARLRVMADDPKRRPTHVLLRGDYRSKGEEVKPAIPAVFGTLPADGKGDRLALARWLVSAKNPLTARVTVNRFWQMIFGEGLARSVDDFGVRGEKPTHPELLDWLSGEFIRSGWDVKHILRLIVTSNTYKQSSTLTPEMLAKDPQNRALARGPRFRLQAELIRDNALAISGLLDRERAVGGPSVKPYQPGDLWRELSAGDDSSKSYVQDKGSDLYRRGLYVWWKRSILYPGLATFDAPKREVCQIRRPITNTPLQAFVTLNDTTYVEAARVFAQRILARGGVNLQTRLTYALRVALGRTPSAKERELLTGIYQDAVAHYRTDNDAAIKLSAVGEAPKAMGLGPAEHAAWTCVCNAILNLDETLNKE